MPDNKNNTRGGCCAAGIVALVFAAVFISWICFTKVPANAVGVRTLAKGGIEKTDYPPGFVLSVPGLHNVRLWDPTWSNFYKHMEVRGGDQYITNVDLSVIFRIKPGMCHEIAGKYTDYNAIEQNVDQILQVHANEVLTKMKTEDYYNAEVRNPRTTELKERMEKDFSAIFLELKSVLLRNIVYDPNFESLLLKKQVAGQTLSLEMSRTEQAKGETATELIQKKAIADVISIDESLTQEKANLNAETDQRISKMNQDAMLQAAVITAKAQADKRIKMAKADLLKAEATAYGTSAMSKVYSKPGASYYFAQKSLQSIHLGNIEVNSNTFNPLDTDRLLKALGLDLHTPGGVIQSK